MWQKIHISIGVAVHDPEIDRTVEETVHRADQIMYEKKRAFKDGR